MKVGDAPAGAADGGIMGGCNRAGLSSMSASGASAGTMPQGTNHVPRQVI